MSSLKLSRRLARDFSNSALSRLVPPSPNNLSNTNRGCASEGNGVVAEDQERLF